MIKLITINLFLFLTISAQAQLTLKDSLITAKVYDEYFKPANENTEKWLSETLKGKTLKYLVDENIISRDDMRDLALPLGVFKNSDSINFSKGMIDMWKMKAARIKRKYKSGNSSIFVVALKGIEASLKPTTLSTINSYRENDIAKETKKLKKLHQKIKSKYSKERAVFMDIITENLSPNVILGFNIQELLPPTHMLGNGEIMPINPIFKAYYFDRLLQEAGTDFILYYPARYDVINSYGPFQITPVAIADIKANDRLIDDFKIYKSMDDLETIDDHISAATIFAYNNWERLSILLKHDGTLEKFNNYFADYKNDKEKKRKLRIIISGLTACMHHNPPKSWKIARNYLKGTDSLKNMHYECIKNHGGKQLRKYYKSSVEAYLIMKVYHKLFP